MQKVKQIRMMPKDLPVDIVYSSLVHKPFTLIVLESINAGRLDRTC